MSYVVRHPSGQYIQVWISTVDNSSRIHLLPSKAGASSYRKRSETSEVLKQIPGATVEVR